MGSIATGCYCTAGDGRAGSVRVGEGGCQGTGALASRKDPRFLTELRARKGVPILGFGSTAAQVQSLKPLVRGRIALRVPETLIAAEDRRAICRSAARACAPNATILVAANPLP